MSVLLIFLINYLLLSVGLYLLFPKVGIDAWKGLVPGLNFVEVAKLVGRPAWYAALLLIPTVQFFIYAGLMIHLVKSFGRTSWFDSFLAVVFPIVILYQIAKDDKTTYLGPYFTDRKAYQSKIEDAKKSGDKREYKKLLRNDPYRLSVGREWLESIIFAVFAAAFIRMFLVEAFMIPTPSMENSLNVGDYLFVSKTRYGMRTPMTIAQIPLLHNRIPGLNKESYWEKPSLNYHRLPALESIDNNDPIVFNWPVGDSVYLAPSRSWAVGQIERNPEILQRDRALKALVNKKQIITRPIDKKDHYIKRAIGIGGDTIQIKNRQVYINGTAVENPTNIQFLYDVRFSSSTINTKKWSDWGISTSDVYQGQLPNSYLMFLSEYQKNKLMSLDPNASIEHREQKSDGNKLFPHNTEYFGGWTVDDYGPVWIPKQGETIDLTPQNIAMYERTIRVYEHNEVTKTSNGELVINGLSADTYTFKQDYFWAMGDNRHNSEDSRAWGFVPHDHIVGKPLFLFFSTREGNIGKGINWDRIFTSASKM